MEVPPWNGQPQISLGFKPGFGRNLAIEVIDLFEMKGIISKY